MKLIVQLAIIVCAGFIFAPVLSAQDKVEVIPEKILTEDAIELLQRQLGQRKIKGLKLGAVSPNELKGYEFFRSGRLKGLRLGISTQEDVSKIFGSTCKEVCRYDSDWNIFVEYLGENSALSSYTIDGDGNKSDVQTFVVMPEHAGKIDLIRLIPTKRMSFAGVVFPDEFGKHSGMVIGHDFDGGAIGVSLDTYTDGYGLSYVLFDKTEYDTRRKKEKDKSLKDDLMSIEYRIPREIEEKVYIEQKPDNK